MTYFWIQSFLLYINYFFKILDWFEYWRSFVRTNSNTFSLFIHDTDQNPIIHLEESMTQHWIKITSIINIFVLNYRYICMCPKRKQLPLLRNVVLTILHYIPVYCRQFELLFYVYSRSNKISWIMKKKKKNCPCRVVFTNTWDFSNIWKHFLVVVKMYMVCNYFSSCENDHFTKPLYRFFQHLVPFFY